MRALLSAATALVPIMLAGCSLFNGPTPIVLKRCVVIGDLPTGQPLSVLEKALTANGARAQWQRGNGRTYILRLTKTNQLTGKTDRIALEIDQADNGMTGPECGPGSAIITQLNINGDDMGAMVAQNILIPGLEKYLGHKLGQTPAAPAPALPPPAPEQASTTLNEADVETEVAADQEFYARAEKAAAKPITISDRGYRYCCLTVGRLLNELRARGVTATIDTDDEGTIWIDAKSPTPLWLGHSNLSLEFHPVGSDGAVELRSIKAGELEIADARGGTGTPAASYLTENFSMSKTAE